MAQEFMDPEAAMKLLELASSSYRPKEITELQDKIDGEIRAAQLAADITGSIDDKRIQMIAEMKFQLDALYVDWAEGKIS